MKKRGKIIITLCVAVLLLLMANTVSVMAAGSTGKRVQITFNNSKGTSTARAYTSLKITAKSNSYVTLPKVPEVTGYKNLGWSQSVGATVATYEEGSKIKVRSSMKLYAVRKKSVYYKVTLCNKNGTVYKAVTIKSMYIKLPSMENPSGFTFMGWSKSSNQSVNPTYQAGETLRVNRNMRLYAVMYDRSTEPNIKGANMTRLNKQKYDRVIFVGDSRTHGMSLIMNREFDSSVMDGVSFLGTNGQKLAGFKSHAYPQLLQMIKSNNAGYKKKTAVVFNLGVNNLRHEDGEGINCKKVIASYVNYMNGISKTLSKMGCSLYYMSVNPFNSAMMYNDGVRNEAELPEFNEGLQMGLNHSFTYIDTFSYLMKTGYSTQRSAYEYITRDDGTHYTSQTYKRIYRFCMKKINE